MENKTIKASPLASKKNIVSAPDVKAAVVLNRQDKVRVVNRTLGSVALFAPNFNGKRFFFPKKDSHLYISLEELDDIMQTIGGSSYLRDGISIANPQAREFLGLMDYEEEEFDMDKVRELLGPKVTAESFERMIQNLAPSLRDRLVQEAIELELGDFDKAEVLEKHSGVKIMQAIALKRELARERKTK